LEPPSALAKFNPDGSQEVWLPNQAPDMFRADIVKRTGLELSRITLHSPLVGGFFGRHFLYDSASPYPQAINLSKAVGRPVKLIWSREEGFSAGRANFQYGERDAVVVVVVVVDEIGREIASSREGKVSQRRQSDTVFYI
jgi:CO/xanthine dehydrogenase Mo-binding subunit